LDVHLIAYTP